MKAVEAFQQQMKNEVYYFYSNQRNLLQQLQKDIEKRESYTSYRLPETLQAVLKLEMRNLLSIVSMAFIEFMEIFMKIRSFCP